MLGQAPVTKCASKQARAVTEPSPATWLLWASGLQPFKDVEDITPLQGVCAGRAG